MNGLAPLDAVFAALPRESRWWVALSGGADSVALLYRLMEWAHREAQPPAISAVHVHHGISDQADQWAALCAEHCQQLAVPCQLIKTDPLSADASGLEATAREARYRVFEQLLEEGELLLMAHHLDDQVETVLFRLLRGAGPNGLRGIPRRRRLGSGQLVRPLLDVSRTDIVAWADARGLRYVDDPANADLRHDRNFLRHEVLPLIAGRWPGYRNTIARAAALQAEWVAATDGWQDGFSPSQNMAGEPLLPVNSTLSMVALSQHLHRWLADLGLMAPDRDALREFARQVLSAAEDRLPELVLGPWRLVRWRSGIHLTERQVPTLVPTRIRAGEAAHGVWGTLHWQTSHEQPGIRSGSVIDLRAALPGERVKPLGRPGRELGRWWQERAVPPWWRQRLPVLLGVEGQAVAVLGAGLLETADSTPLMQGGLMPVWAPNRHDVELSG